MLVQSVHPGFIFEKKKETWSITLFEPLPHDKDSG